jgi:ATP-binding cassette subfamily F protein uup
MNYLVAEKISKSYGDKVLFDHISFRINRGDKIALIARNGSGKSTLLEVITGAAAAEGENARLLVSQEIRTGYLHQDPVMENHVTVLDYILTIDQPQFIAYRKYLDAHLIGNEKSVRDTTLEMDDHKAWSVEAKIHELFARLNIINLDQQIGQLSGGQKKRVALGKLILEEPDFLILDEPTNHLDTEMIEWLEDLFSRPLLTLLVVTHDRYFLDRVCNQILELESGKLIKYSGNYSDYLEKKSLRTENESTRIAKSRKLLGKELEWIRRMPKARGTKAKSRIAKFEEIKVEAARKIYDDPMRVSVKMSRMGSKIIELYHVSKSFGELQIVSDFSYKFKKGERLGIIGPNGVGKTSFLHLLTKQLRLDSGKIVHGETIQIGYYTQEGLTLEKGKRVIDVIRDIAEYLPMKGGYKLTAEKLLENFLFPRPQQQIYFSQLSGGEQRRLHLLTVLMSNPNFLILDEPTNDLDILTLNVLEEFLLNFQGCIIIASHDRYMLDKLVDHLFVFEGAAGIRDFPGNYTHYMYWLKNQPGKAIEAKSSAEKVSTGDKNRYEERKSIRRLEKQIEKLEAKKNEIQHQFLDNSLSVEEVQKLHTTLTILEKDLTTMEKKWLSLVDNL